jgi:hypothetical protein
MEPAHRFVLEGDAAGARQPWIAFALEGTTPGKEPDPEAGVWVNTGYEGNWRGHSEGPFSWTKADLEAMVESFRASPKYRPGAPRASADDIKAGKFDHLMYDWRHAYEMRAPGDVPMAEQVARGYALEMEVRPGKDPKTGAPRWELWAFSRFLGEAAQFIRQKAVKWVSMVAHKNAPEQVSGERRRWWISTIALTPTPFMEGLHPILLEYHPEEQQTQPAPDAGNQPRPPAATTKGPIIMKGIRKFLLERQIIAATTPEDAEADMVIALEQRLREGDAARRDLPLVLGALGAPDATAAGRRIADLLKAEADHKADGPKLEEYRKGQIAYEQELAAYDVQRVALEYGIAEQGLGALKLARGCHLPPEKLEERAAARKVFLENYPQQQRGTLHEQQLRHDYFSEAARGGFAGGGWNGAGQGGGADRVVLDALTVNGAPAPRLRGAPEGSYPLHQQPLAAPGMQPLQAPLPSPGYGQGIGGTGGGARFNLAQYPGAPLQQAMAFVLEHDTSVDWKGIERGQDGAFRDVIGAMDKWTLFCTKAGNVLAKAASLGELTIPTTT